MNELDFKDIFDDKGKMVAIYGKSGSGKTTLMKHIIRETRDIYTHVFLFQGSKPSIDNVYIDCVWPDNIRIISVGEKNAVQALQNELKSITEFATTHNAVIVDENKRNNTSNPKINVLVVIDDFVTKANQIKDMLGTARHSPLTCVLLLHSSTNIDKTYRSFIDVFMINIQFELHLLESVSPKLSDDFQQCKTLGSASQRMFYVYTPHNNTSSYVEVNASQLKEMKTGIPTTVYYSSKQRSYLVKFLKSLAEDIKKENK